MNHDKMRQIEEDQRNEDMHFAAASIFAGLWSYRDFLATHPDEGLKKNVDDWLRGNLVGEDKDKIIPGFND